MPATSSMRMTAFRTWMWSTLSSEDTTRILSLDRAAVTPGRASPQDLPPVRPGGQSLQEDVKCGRQLSQTATMWRA
ncbi:hypothetical protein Airi02_071320 [Actinoallomurus iriomotensis]|uniref:Uncharacterized protein n=1 Tax=Actinoallomurus iriomotensis TaxID=478107 RepID=A0A9W6S8V4_9ACTN|nr:hypothetical protein Airi02_071320 [Actinoallomurus iriomotensis]